MKVQGKVIVVTGGASGIGEALCRCFAHAGAARVIVADIDREKSADVARSIDGEAAYCDVTDEDQIRHLVEMTESTIGPIDLFCSNAGIATGFDTTFENAAGAPNDVWAKAWAVNVMAHVYAARVLIPRMKARKRGYFLLTASAAGLLSQVGSAVYSTTKHAAVGFAENLAITHHDHGIRVSILCPQGVDTPLLRDLPSGPQAFDGILSADAVSKAALEGIEAEQFLILPHQEVKKYLQFKTQEYDEWIRRMARLQQRAYAS
ncbi:SDR family oxidoreductase [Microvirga sp. 2YAF29]|uniref:SDR family oxidoreductase n=1 Tax=Microvirga sp. 2YAF29 TaxID=3233031 RepID=UPI003F9CF47F